MSSNVLNIRIVGCGCSLCETVKSNVKRAAEQANIEYELKIVCDYATKMTPILFVDDKLVIAGKVLSVIELQARLESLVQNDGIT